VTMSMGGYMIFRHVFDVLGGAQFARNLAASRPSIGPIMTKRYIGLCWAALKGNRPVAR